MRQLNLNLIQGTTQYYLVLWLPLPLHRLLKLAVCLSHCIRLFQLVCTSLGWGLELGGQSGRVADCLVTLCPTWTCTQSTATSHSPSCLLFFSFSILFSNSLPRFAQLGRHAIYCNFSFLSFSAFSSFPPSQFSFFSFTLCSTWLTAQSTETPPSSPSFCLFPSSSSFSSKGGADAPKTLKILALPRLAWHPSTHPLPPPIHPFQRQIGDIRPTFVSMQYFAKGGMSTPPECFDIQRCNECLLAAGRSHDPL